MSLIRRKPYILQTNDENVNGKGRVWLGIAILLAVVLVVIAMNYPDIWRYKAVPKSAPETGYESVTVINSITGCKVTYHDVQDARLSGCWFRSRDGAD
jgi:hypothetical protein